MQPIFIRFHVAARYHTLTLFGFSLAVDAITNVGSSAFTAKGFKGCVREYAKCGRANIRYGIIYATILPEVYIGMYNVFTSFANQLEIEINKIMPEKREKHFGWPEFWFDGNREVNELHIRFYASRYFTLPEDWGENDSFFTMFWVKCPYCGYVFERFLSEEEFRETHVYRGDETWRPINGEAHECEQNDAEAALDTIDFDYSNIYGDLSSSYFESPLERYFCMAWRLRNPNIELDSQYPVGRRRLDFAHVETKTAIEIDGKPYHSQIQQLEEDRKRQALIEERGWSFIRFSGSEVHYHIWRCIEQLEDYISARKYAKRRYIRF